MDELSKMSSALLLHELKHLPQLSGLELHLKVRSLRMMVSIVSLFISVCLGQISQHMHRLGSFCGP